MFGKYFYNQNIRNIVVLFGTVFNDISIRRSRVKGVPNDATDVHFKVPIAYGPKQKYLKVLDERRIGDGDIDHQITLPRMSFEITAMNYDGTRKLQRTKRHTALNTDNTKLTSAYTPVPYNFEVELNVMVRNSDDGSQILEQIMPYFTPEFHVTLNEMSTMGIKRDIPIVMNSLTTQDTYEGDFFTRRALIHTLSFTVLGFVYGPTSNINLIREVDVNVGAQIPNPAEANLNIDVKPDPLNADADDDFGFTTTLTDV